MAEKTNFEDTPPRSGVLRQRLFRIIGSIELWIVLSLIFTALMHFSNPNSPESTWLWWLDPLLSILFLVLMKLSRRIQIGKLVHLSRMWAAIAFVFSSWLLGMLTELTISTGAGGYGGLHEKTIPSFILAQGYYLPLAVLGLWLVRRYQLNFYELFFVAGMTSLYEAVFFGIPLLMSPTFFLSPIVFAFYFVIYSRLLSMVLLFVDQEALWAPTVHLISFRRKLLYGFLVGIACWIIYVAWGETMNFVFDKFKSF